MKKWLLMLGLLASVKTFCQPRQTENLMVVVLDGMRWQEVFTGADSVLVHHPAFTKNKDRIIRKFWDPDPGRRRAKLFPFLWNEVAAAGPVFGNRLAGNYMDVTNPVRLTYAGFSEMLTGFADPAITSNRLVTSQSDNVLEYINTQKGFEGKVALFATSDLFPYLLNRSKSKLYINSDSDSLAFDSPEFRLLNDMQRLSAKPTTERPDLLTYFAAREYIKAYNPRVLYLALGDTDAAGHQGNYEQYLETARTEDEMIAQLWKMIQSMPQYRNKTTLLLTCDHGRGDRIKEQWVAHGSQIADSGQIWLAAIGPDITLRGEIKTAGHQYQAQIAATIASILGLEFRPQTHQASGAIPDLVKK